MEDSEMITALIVVGTVILANDILFWVIS